jgi:hypothetical protein
MKDPLPMKPCEDFPNKKDDLVVITTRSIVRKDEAPYICDTILQILGGDGVTLVDLGCTYDSLSDGEYKEYLDQMDLMDDQQ